MEDVQISADLFRLVRTMPGCAEPTDEQIVEMARHFQATAQVAAMMRQPMVPAATTKKAS